MHYRFYRSTRFQAGYSWPELLFAALIIAGLFVGAGVWRKHSGYGPVFLQPVTAESAKRLIEISLTDVEKVGELVITGERTVTLPVTIAKKACQVQLYAPEKLENDYGWKIKKVDCPSPASA